MATARRQIEVSASTAGIRQRFRGGLTVVLLVATLWLPACHQAAEASLLPPAPESSSHDLAADDEDRPSDRSELAAGLSMRYALADQIVWHRSEPTPYLHPDFAPLTPLATSSAASDGERVEWTGLLLARPGGTFQLSLQAVGEVAVWLDQASVDLISQPGSRDGEATWYLTPPLELTGGLYPIEVHYRPPPRTATDRHSAAQLRLFWSSTHFPLEPLPPDHLFHQTSADTPAAADADVGDWYRGREWVEGLGCANCHAIDGIARDSLAPDLQSAAQQLGRDWLIDRLTESTADSARDVAHLGGEPHALIVATDRRVHRMPDFGLSREQAQQLVDGVWLASAGSLPAAADFSRAGPPQAGGTLANRPDPIKLGEQLLHSVGCLACHTWQQIGSGSVWSGGTLDHIGLKRTAEFLDAWLTSPATVRPESRMPEVELTADERVALVAFLTHNREPNRPDSQRFDSPPGPETIDRAAALIHRTGCGACHQLPAAIAEALPERARIDARTRHPIRLDALATLDPHQSCLGAPDPQRGRPGYRLADQPSRDVVAYLQMVSTEPSLDWSTRIGTDQLLERQHCLACHPRGIGSGIAETAELVHQRFPTLGEGLAALVPPSLNRIGDKLHAKVLTEQISGEQPKLRPWLSVRMPRYSLDDPTLRLLIDGLIERDRPPELPAALQRLIVGEGNVSAERPGFDLDATAVRSLGGRLVTSGGLGCASCHSIGPVAAPPAPIGARGPNLAGLDQRVRRQWFDRWVANPLRLVPRVEMPAITTAVPGLLDEQLDQQLDVIWKALSLSDFAPPRPNPVRQLRRSGYADDRQASLVIQDLLRADKRRWTKPLLIGLPNRHNLVFDVQSASLDGWWLGDTVNQQTEGKNWYWEAAGSNLWSYEPPQPQLRLLSTSAGAGEGGPLLPQPQGQFIAQLDGWHHDSTTGGVRFWYRLMYADHQLPAAGSATLRVSEAWEPLWEPLLDQTTAQQSSWRRSIRVQDVPDGWQPQFRPFASSSQPLFDSERGRLRIELSDRQWLEVRQEKPTRTAARPAAIGPARLQAAEQASRPVLEPGSDGWLALDGERDETVLVYSTTVPKDRFPMIDRPRRVRPETPIAVVPGFDGEELPLPPEMMPTGMSWQNENTLLVTDLKGSIWQVDWPSSPGNAAHAVEVADQLSTPFGIVAYRDYLDVSTKSGLLRLSRSTPGPRYDRVEVVADGWGHTDDYHDWAVGLVQRDGGEYFLALSCQQDNRSPAAAHLRGDVVRLIPRAATEPLPRAFRVESYTRGHRFPIGIAADSELGLFVTDNQGHYKPFNELNRLEAGQHYGFINALQRGTPQPDRQAAVVHIPHPWTRSVNGICFLRSPANGSPSGPNFGPLEGHLIGCEYDTRQLVRMTVQEVDGLWQGAVYPFSLPPAADAPGLRGPITCSVSPQGDLVIGNLRETGWGSGKNDGSLVRLRLAAARLPAGIVEMRVVHDGFMIQLSGPIDPKRAVDPNRFRLDSYTREATPQYGGADKQRRRETITGIRYDAERQLVHAPVDRLRPGFVYELSLESLAPDGESFFPAEAHYTLHTIPQR